MDIKSMYKEKGEEEENRQQSINMAKITKSKVNNHLDHDSLLFHFDDEAPKDYKGKKQRKQTKNSIYKGPLLPHKNKRKLEPEETRKCHRTQIWRITFFP